MIECGEWGYYENDSLPQDAAWQNYIDTVQNASPNVLTFGETSPSYHASFVSLSVRYKF